MWNIESILNTGSYQTHNVGTKLQSWTVYLWTQRQNIKDSSTLLLVRIISRTSTCVRKIRIKKADPNRTFVKLNNGNDKNVPMWSSCNVEKDNRVKS